MSTAYYPWYTYIKNILRGNGKITQRERDAVAAALEAATPETRALIKAVYIAQAKTLHAAAQDNYMSFRTVQRHTSGFLKDVARRLDLLEE